MKRNALIIGIFLAMISTGALSDCDHEGNTYAEGSEIKGYKCENGNWIKIEKKPPPDEQPQPDDKKQQ